MPANRIEPGPTKLPAVALGTCLAAITGFFVACQTPPSGLPPLNLSEPGWTLRQGQAVWRPNSRSPEIAGELLVATHFDGRAFVQFTKTPLPFVVAQITTHSWQIQFVPENRTFSGRGRPAARLIWLHLPGCLAGAPPPPPLAWQPSGTGNWRLQHRSTGESLEGYLTP